MLLNKRKMYVFIITSSSYNSYDMKLMRTVQQFNNKILSLSTTNQTAVILMHIACVTYTYISFVDLYRQT